MRRVITVVFLLAATGAFALSQAGAGEDGAPAYWVELDNAFGLVVGGDLKVAGVRAGKVTHMKVDRETKRALVRFEITKNGFGSLRSDTFCESRPQSLIGEYFIDCLPGTNPQELEVGSTIPVSRTASTVPADLLNNVLRRPYRERLRIIVDELGYGLGGRAEDLNEAIRRASPALRETNKVLRVLARQNKVLRDLVKNGDEVIGDLADNRKDVSRWVRETGETATASAERREAIAASLQRLPEFLRQLRPTMAELGRTADAQTPTLTDLEASASQLETLFDQLKPFAESSRANFKSLAEAARPGKTAVRAARGTAAELEKFSEKAPEVSKNLAIILRHLDDRKASAVEPGDPRSPGGQGYSGLEAILQYVFDQTMAINVFDENGYILKVNVFEGHCAPFQNLESAKAEQAANSHFLEECFADLGPNQPGFNQPDPSAQSPAQRRANRINDPRLPVSDRRAPDGQVDRAGAVPQAKAPVDLGKTLEGLLGPLPGPNSLLDPQKLPGALGQQFRDQANRDTSDALVDFLFGS